ncbi:MAG: DUF4407 domain-containing protein [Cyanobacteria bacterium J06649_12]
MYDFFDRVRSFFIWWTGVDMDIFNVPELRRLRKPYTGLGALAMLSTVMAVVGAYSFIWSSLSHRWGAILAALMAGLFMWAFDRSILGYISPNPGKAWLSNVIKLLINVTFSTVLAIPLATDVLNGGIKADILQKTEDEIERVSANIESNAKQLSAKQVQIKEHAENYKIGLRADGTRNLAYDNTTEILKQSEVRLAESETALMEKLHALEQERLNYRNGSFNNRNPEFSFPQKLNRVLSAASDDNALPLGEKIIAGITFLLSAIAGAGAVLARMIFIGTDSYSRRWRAEETIDCDNEDLKLKIARKYLQSDSFIDERDSSPRDFKTAMSNSIRESMLDMIPRRRHPEVHQQYPSASVHTNSGNQNIDDLWKSHNEGEYRKRRDAENIFSLFSGLSKI